MGPVGARGTVVHHRGVVHRERARGEHGAVLIEFAIVLPVMLIIAFGLLQLGFAFKTSSTVTGATRTGARVISSTYPAAARAGVAERDLALDNIRISIERDLVGLPAQAVPTTLWIYEADVNGDPTSGPSCTSSCIRYTWNPGTEHFDQDAGTDWPDPTSCGADVDRVGVQVTALHDIDSPFLNDLVVTRDTIMRLEPVTDAAC